LPLGPRKVNENKPQTNAQQVAQPERRIARVSSSMLFGRRPVSLDVMPQDHIMNATPSSYDPPQAEAQATSAASRASLAALLQSFLASEITAFQFDEQLDAFRDSDDPVIRHVVDAVWYHYDDCDDHWVCFSKEQWDYFQRLLLVLASNGRIETESKRQWSLKQLIAAMSLCMFGLFALQLGWGYQLLSLSVPFGFISIALSFWQPKVKPNPDPFASAIFPFATFVDLATAYHSSGFRKTRYPKHISKRTIRSPFMETFWRLHSYTMWLFLSPFPLLFQSIPAMHTETRIKAA